MANISTKDLNLLVVFEALMAERNVSRAAARLHLSQPAMSHALARLREMMGDELFVRVARGVTPTPRALELAPVVAEAMEKVRRVFEAPEAFDPAKARGRITLLSTEYFEQLVLPDLLPRLAREAPGLTLLSRSTGGRLPKEEMERGECDLAVAGFFSDLPEGFYAKTMLEDHFACVVRRGHPRVKKSSLDLDGYLALEHLLISPQGDMQGIVDRALAKKKKSRRVVAGIASFVTPAWVIANSDMILTAPGRLAHFYAKHLPLTVLDVPLTLPPVKLIMAWHERTNADPLHRWFRRLVAEAIA